MSRPFKGAAFSWWGKILLVVDIIGFGVSQKLGEWLYDSSARRGLKDYLGLVVIVPVYVLVVKIKNPSRAWKDTWRVDPMDGDAAAIGMFCMHVANLAVGSWLSVK